MEKIYEYYGETENYEAYRERKEISKQLTIVEENNKLREFEDHDEQQKYKIIW